MTREEFSKKKEYNRWIDKMYRIEEIIMKNCQFVSITEEGIKIIFKSDERKISNGKFFLAFKDFPDEGL